MRLKFLLLCFFSAWPFGGLAFAEEAVFYKITVEPVQDVPKLFIARGQRIHVLFHSYQKNTLGDEVEIFPKSPLIVTDHKAVRSCTIADTGDWVRGRVYLNSDERYLLMEKHQERGHYIVSYDTRTCQQIKELELSGEPWRIDGSHGYFGEKCSGERTSSCASVRELDLSGIVNERFGANIFHRVAVEPLKGLPKPFVTDGKHISILFYNYTEGVDDKAIDAFPEPPLIVQDKQSKKICAIEEGGIWIREEIYFSQDERYLLIGEYDGSWCGVASYDMRSCQLVKRLDISGFCRRRIEGNQAVLGGQCSNDDFSSCSLLKPLDLNQFIKAK